MDTPGRAEVRSESENWRLELRKKVRGTERELNDVPPGPAQTTSTPAGWEREKVTDLERPLFQPRVQGPSAEPRPVSFQIGRPAPQESVLEKPLVRMGEVAERGAPPLQRELNLHTVIPEAQPFRPDALEELEPKAAVSREILFSRLLAGIIDLLFPSLLGLTLAFSASELLNFDFLAPFSLRLIGVHALAFFFFNSLFFLLASGQTPGMYLTELKLEGEEPGPVSPAQVLLRVALFLPILISLIGILWAVFEPGRRCLHDILTRTRVSPVTGEP